MRNASHPGQVITNLLGTTGRNAQWLATATGINKTALDRTLAGHEPLNLHDAAAIADALDVEIQVLVNGTAEEAVGIPQIARMLGVSTDTVYRKARAGEIPGFKVGGLWRFFPDSVREHLTTPKTDPWRQSARSLARKRVA